MNESPKEVPQKFRIEQSTSSLQEIAQQLSDQFPNNDLVKKLQGALGDHLECLKQFLSDFETPEEKERKRSLVLIGLPESNAPKASERANSDLNSITEILDILDVAAKPTTVYRMGHPDPNRFPEKPRKGPRVLKVVMPSSAIQRQVLAALRKHRNELKSSKKFERCLVRPSLTPEQRALDKQAHDELRRRKQAGEKNLFIKNFKVFSNDAMSGDF